MTLQAPFPYFGGKRRAAEVVWRALGDPGGYVEPFAGSAAVLLARPEVKGRRVETLNDADGWLVNMWRAIKLSPDETARHSAGPVTEIDYHARLAWLQERRGEDLVSWLEGDPEAHDPKAAGWWLYVAACGIGDPWGPGPWRVIDGRLQDSRNPAPGQRRAGHPPGGEDDPHLSSAGQGVNREIPHLSSAGQGVNREIPHLGDAGRGIHRALPHLGNAGQEDLLAAYFIRLSWRLERVRIICGGWRRALTPSAGRATAGNGTRGVFLDPPYATSGDLYASTNARGDDAHTTIAAEVREWCSTQADRDLRIVLCGYDDEHDALLEHGWRRTEWKSGGGYGGKEADRERLWLSPACIGAEDGNLFDLLDGDAS